MPKGGSCPKEFPFPYMPSDNVLSRGQHSPCPPTQLHQCRPVLVEFCHKHAQICTTTHQWHRIEEAGFTSLLTPSEGRFSTSKGDIRIQTRPLTRLAEKPGSTMGGAIKIGLVEKFVVSGCSSRLLTRPPFVGRDRILTLPAREYCVWWRYPEKVPRSPAGQLLG